MSIELFQGESLALMTSIQDHSVDAIINDPPYGTTQCKWDIAIDLDELWSEYRRILKPNGVIVMFSAQPFTSKLIVSNMEMYRYTWYWEKEKGTNFLSTGYQPLRVIEEVSVFSRNTKFVYNAQMVPLDKPYTHTMPIKKSNVAGSFSTQNQDVNSRLYKTYTHSHPKNLIKFSRDNIKSSPVQTQKPIELMRYLVETYTNPGQLVLDNTMGSGTTGVACRELGRSFIGIEMDPVHFDYAKARIEAVPDDGIIT